MNIKELVKKKKKNFLNALNFITLVYKLLEIVFIHIFPLSFLYQAFPLIR